MKTQLLFLFVLFLLYCLPNATKAEQTQDSLNPCWELFRHEPDKGYFNPDSVMYDSCLCPDKFECKFVYAKKWFNITFKHKDPFSFPEGPRDTIYIAKWQQIDTNQIELSSLFHELEIMYGKYIFKKEYPDIIDSNSLASRNYLIKFDSYCKVDSVVNYLKNSNLLYYVYYENKVAHFLSDLEYLSEYKENLLLQNEPNPCQGYTLIKFNLIHSKYIEIYLCNIIDNKKILIDYGLKSPGLNQVYVNTNSFNTGIYIYYMIINNKYLFKKLEIIK